jgi:hypothetical protein
LASTLMGLVISGSAVQSPRMGSKNRRSIGLS